MNCVVERRRAEELVDAPAKEMALPFGINLMSDPKKQKVTGERIAIVCESNTEPREEERNTEPEVHIRQFIVPIQRPAQLPIPYGRMPDPQMGPMTHMPLRMDSAPPMNQVQPPQMMPPQMGPHPFIRQLIAQAQAAQAAQQRPPVPQQMMQAPPVQEPQIRIFRMQNEPEMQAPPQIRIQLHRIAIPEQMRAPEQVLESSEEQQPQQPRLQVQQMPLNEALQRAGITPEDLDNIRKIAEEKFQQEMTRFMEADDEIQSDESDEEAPTQVMIII